MYIVTLKKNDEMFNLKVGQTFLAKPYPIDPGKMMLLTRLTKKGKMIGKKWICNQYNSNIESKILVSREEINEKYIEFK